VLEQLLREVELVQAVDAGEVPGRTGAQERVVVVVGAGDDLLALAARRVLAGDISEVRCNIVKSCVQAYYPSMERHVIVQASKGKAGI
jgi:hypothetical protein